MMRVAKNPAVQHTDSSFQKKKRPRRTEFKFQSWNNPTHRRLLVSSRVLASQAMHHGFIISVIVHVAKERDLAEYVAVKVGFRI